MPVDEAIAFLNTTAAVDALAWDQYLGFAAKDLAVAQGPTGETGHTSPASDGATTMATRIDKYGQFVGTAGENIAYGTTGGRAIVLQLIIDDGVPARGHRTNIFKAAYKYLGAFTANHTVYRTETVIDYAGGLTSNGAYPLTASTAPSSNTTTTTNASNSTTTSTTSSNTTNTTSPTPAPAPVVVEPTQSCDASATTSNTIVNATNPGPTQSVV